MPSSVYLSRRQFLSGPSRRRAGLTLDGSSVLAAPTLSLPTAITVTDLNPAINLEAYARGSTPITYGATGAAVASVSGGVVFLTATPGTYSVDVTATNSEGADSATVSVTVTDVAVAAIALPPTLDLGVGVYTLDLSAYATGTAPLSYSAEGSGVVSVVGSTLTTVTTPGDYSVTVEAENLYGSGSDTFTVTVTAPVLPALSLPATLTREDTNNVIDLSAYAAGSPTLTYNVTGAGVVSVSGSNVTVSSTPGTYALEVGLANAFGSDNGTFSVTVTDTTVPTLEFPGTLTIYDDDPSISIPQFTIGAPPFTYEALGPGVVDVDAAGIITFVTARGTYSTDITATNAFGSDSATVGITVAGLAAAWVNFPASISLSEADPTLDLELYASGTDPLTYDATGAAVTDVLEAVVTFTSTPGTYSVEFIISNEEATDSVTVPVEVVAIGVAPTLALPLSVTVTQADLTIDLSAYVTAGTPPLTYAATGAGVASISGSVITMVSGAADYPVDVTVTNAEGEDAALFTVTVAPSVTAPVIVMPATVNIAQADLTLDLANYTTGTDPITYGATGPAVASISGSVITFNSTVGSFATDVTVTNAAGSDAITFTAAVAAVPVRNTLVGLNTNESLLNGYGPQYYYVNMFRTARGVRVRNGATVDANLYPASSEVGNSLSVADYKMAHWNRADVAPYMGDFILITNGTGEVVVEFKTGGGANISVHTFNVSGAARNTFTRASYAGTNYMQVYFRDVSVPFTELALIHSSHETNYDAGEEITPEMFDLWTTTDSVVRFMKLNRADDNPEEVIRGDVNRLIWTGDATTRYAMPYETIINECAANSVTPWICLHANATDAEIDALSTLIANAGVTVKVEFGNEPFHAPKGGSPYSYWGAQALAKWGPGTPTDASGGRQWLAWRFSQIIDRFTANNVRGLIRTVYADQGNWSGWLKQTFSCPLWVGTAAGDGEEDRLARWQSGSMIDEFAGNAYFGGDVIDKGYIAPGDVSNPDLLRDACITSINARCTAMGTVKADLQAWWPTKSIYYTAYEGGNSLYGTQYVYFQNTPQMNECMDHWFERCENSANLALNVHYADLSGQGGQGSWDIIPYIGAPLDTEAKGEALLDYLTGTPAVPAEVFLETFPATATQKSNFYGPQASNVQHLVAATGARVATTYLDIQGTDHYNFLRDGIVHDGPHGAVLVCGQSRLGSDAQGTELGLVSMSLDLSTVHARWHDGNDTASSHDGQPAVVSDGTHVWAIMSVEGAVDTTGSAPGFDGTFSGGTHSRIFVGKFSLDASHQFTLVEHTYLQDQSGTGGMFGETHGIALRNGKPLIAGECFGATFGAIAGLNGTSYDSTPPTVRKGFVVELEADLSAVTYASYFGADGGDSYFDGVDTHSDGSYCMAFVDATGGAPVTDGSSQPTSGDNSGLLVVFNSDHTLAFSGYITESTSGSSYQSAVRRAVFDPAGSIYVGGWQGTSSPNAPTGRVWKYSQGGVSTFSRPLPDDASFASPNVSAIAGLTNKLTVEYKGSFGLESNLELFAHNGNEARLMFSSAGAGTALTCFLWMEGTPAANSGANTVNSDAEYTVRAMWDGSKGEARVYIQGGDPATPSSYYATDTLLVTESGNSTSWVFTSVQPLTLLNDGDLTSLGAQEYVKLWYDVEADWSLPAGAADETIDGSNANSHAWKTGPDTFTITGGGGAWAEDWSYDFAVTSSGSGQIRGIVAHAGGAYFTGGISGYTVTPDHEHVLTGGTGGNSAFKLKAFAAHVTGAGALDWLTVWGGTTDYHRQYGIAEHNGSIYTFGRAGNALLTGVA